MKVINVNKIKKMMQAKVTEMFSLYLKERGEGGTKQKDGQRHGNRLSLS